ncbi:MAG TPA: PIN domain nuclease [Syntrophobacteraceae bacterium]|nr:PIN domain nuclease [Syntrophobacteraceae bacterium]
MVSWKVISRSPQISWPNIGKRATVNAPRKIVLDSFALLSLFHKEPGWERVRETLQDLAQTGDQAALNIINWGEFYYIIRRRVGVHRAEEALALLEQLPITLVSVDDLLVREAAEIKADHPVSYADAFCIATALRRQAEILTSDPEFQAVAHLVPIVWLSGGESP